MILTLPTAVLLAMNASAGNSNHTISRGLAPSRLRRSRIFPTQFYNKKSPQSPTIPERRHGVLTRKRLTIEKGQEQVSSCPAPWNISMTNCPEWLRVSFQESAQLYHIAFYTFKRLHIFPAVEQLVRGDQDLRRQPMIPQYVPSCLVRQNGRNAWHRWHLSRR